jgi:hypothetical protein
MPVYVAQEGLTPATGMFLARLNGQRALVIEAAIRKPDYTNLGHDAQYTSTQPKKEH